MRSGHRAYSTNLWAYSTSPLSVWNWMSLSCGLLTMALKSASSKLRVSWKQGSRLV